MPFAGYCMYMQALASSFPRPALAWRLLLQKLVLCLSRQGAVGPADARGMPLPDLPNSCLGNLEYRQVRALSSPSWARKCKQTLKEALYLAKSEQETFSCSNLLVGHNFEIV